METKISVQTDIAPVPGMFWAELGFETHLGRGVETLGLLKARCFICNQCKPPQKSQRSTH